MHLLAVLFIATPINLINEQNYLPFRIIQIAWKFQTKRTLLVTIHLFDALSSSKKSYNAILLSILA